MAVPTQTGKEGTAVTARHREKLRDRGLRRGEVTLLTILYTFRASPYCSSPPY